MKKLLKNLIIERLNENKINLKNLFFYKYPIKVARHFVLDDLLPFEIAMLVNKNFQSIKKMKLLHNYGELKLNYCTLKQLPSLLQDLHYAIQDPEVISLIEEITEIRNQVPDRSRLAGGVSALLKGYYINPHLDNSHDIDRKLYRTVNLLYYASPNWCRENGGNYELWDVEIKNCILVPSFFNRLVVMETNTYSWHAVNPVLCNEPRYCVFNYYFSPVSPEGHEYFHSGSALFFNPLIKARPEQKIRRAIANFRDKLLLR